MVCVSNPSACQKKIFTARGFVFLPLDSGLSSIPLMLFVEGKAPVYSEQLFSVLSIKTISVNDVTPEASSEVDCGEVGSDGLQGGQ
jgi:hypothetical protein